MTPDRPVDWVRDLLRQPPGPWPTGFDGFANVAEAFRQLFREATNNAPAPPDFPVERGVVICAGGWRYYPSLYVTVRMLRHHGCDLPIQVWYLGDRGEFDPRMAAALQRWGPIGWIDANALWRDHQGVKIRRENIDHGWMLKPFAAAFSPFREVLSLDADCYPARPLEPFLEHPELRRVGAAFWPDFKALEPGQYERFGLPVPEKRRSFESGQFFVDKARHWRPLWLACWLNAYHDYVYKHVYGDKDTFNLAWHACNQETCIPCARAPWLGHSFLHRDFDGDTLFVHRTRSKFQFEGDMDGAPVDRRYSTDQHNKKGNTRNDKVPCEKEGFAFFAECDELLRPERFFRFREGTHDRGIWDSINLHDEYRLPVQLRDSDVVLDVGAHIGSFAVACLRRGAGRVVCVEPEPENAQLLRHNLHDRRNVQIVEAAAWRSDACGEAPPLNKLEGPAAANTGANSMLRDGASGLTVKAVPLDELIATAAGEGVLRLLKLDCEGAEFPCLFTARRLGQVQEIVGEFHRVQQIPPAAAVPGFPEFDEDALQDFLETQGFVWVDEDATLCEGIGHFRAVRKPC